MDKLEDIYKDYFKETFDTLGLEVYERSAGQLKLKSKEFRLQLLDDRGLIETYISPVHGQEHFRGIEMYHSLLMLRNYKTKLSQSEKRKILGTRLDCNSQTKFLMDNISELRILLDVKSYKTTLKEIENVGQERSSYL
jgi:hypothetical protein